LLGRTPLARGRFPLLIKFLDAREALSLQVHPRPAAAGRHAEEAATKYEAWYVLDAAPGARLQIGAKPGVTPADVVAALAGGRLEDLLISRSAREGDCFYLPSGVPHALGAGLVVAEIQTPSDVTYRLYDWGRAGLDGRPRELHVEQALANMLYDVAEAEIVPARPTRREAGAAIERLATCDWFSIEHVRAGSGYDCAGAGGEMRVLILLKGRLLTRLGGVAQEFVAGDVVLLPAALPPGGIEAAGDCEYLDVRAARGAADPGSSHAERAS
jgi:mannose-6-phosphate isomerase